MRHQLVIIGNGSAARECYWLAQDSILCDGTWSFKGFLAFEGYTGDLKTLHAYALGTDDRYTPDSDRFVIGIGDPRLRLKAYRKWKNNGAAFINLIHPTAVIHEETVMGEANIIGRSCFCSCGISMGNANYLNGSVTVGHDTVMGDANFFGPFAMALSDNSIGSCNSLGVSSVLLPHAAIGENNTIAPGAYLYKGCRNNALMAGNPAVNIAS